MLTLDAAFARLLETVSPSAPMRLPLAECHGLTLAETLSSPVDSPPFDKALMDGFAVRSTDVATGAAELTIIERVIAGQVPQRAIAPGQATRIMTGAPLPVGCDAVVRVEDTEATDERVTIRCQPLKPETNIIRRGAAMKVGDTVFTAGMQLTPARIGALAELGLATPLVRSRPRVAVLATGDELVSVEQTPGPGQIRNSNEPMLVAQLQGHGANATPLGIARDNRPDLAAKIATGLTHDVLVLSGGVSAGQLDLVPSELAAAGVVEVFHKVDLKPGKPIWFGVLRGDDRPPCYVFGLPGNPVSSLVCCELFVKTALRRLQGITPEQSPPLTATLTAAFRHRSDRPTFYPADLQPTATGWTARMIPWQGSSDLRATVDANGMVSLPPGEKTYDAGTIVEGCLWGG